MTLDFFCFYFLSTASVYDYDVKSITVASKTNLKIYNKDMSAYKDWVFSIILIEKRGVTRKYWCMIWLVE